MSYRQCANLCPVKKYSSQMRGGGGVGGRDKQMLKHVVEWSDATGTICCLAIKCHPHTDWAVANVKKIKATAEVMISTRWSTLHIQPASLAISIAAVFGSQRSQQSLAQAKLNLSGVSAQWKEKLYSDGTLRVACLCKCWLDVWRV